MKTAKVFLTAFGSTVLLAMPAWADQCSYISKKQALMAVSRLNVGQIIYELCEPCGDRTSTPVTINSLSAGTVDYEDFWQVQVNGSGIDLAYVFIDSGTGNQPINLAAIAGCPASGISTVLPPRRNR